MLILTIIVLLTTLVIVTFIIVARPRLIRDAGKTKLVAGMPQLGRKPRGSRRERCLHSPQWHDGKFHNTHDTPRLPGDKSKFKIIREFLFSKHPVATPQQRLHADKTDLRALPADKDCIVWFGHSSFLLQLGGKRILVDPVFHTAAPVNFLIRPFKGTDLYKPDDMPDIDLLILTHNHYDHLDYETVRNLRHRVRSVACPLGVGESLVFWGFHSSCITEMDWWEASSPLPGVTLHCTPARHFSGRTLNDSDQTLWASFVLEAAGKKLFLSGDGGYDTHFRQIGEKYGPFDIAFLENGQYNENWCHVHTMPAEMVQECKDIRAVRVFSIHHGKFAMAYHAWDEPYHNIDMMRLAGIDVLPNKIGQVVEL